MIFQHRTRSGEEQFFLLEGTMALDWFNGSRYNFSFWQHWMQYVFSLFGLPFNLPFLLLPALFLSKSCLSRSPTPVPPFQLLLFVNLSPSYLKKFKRFVDIPSNNATTLMSSCLPMFYSNFAIWPGKSRFGLRLIILPTCRQQDLGIATITLPRY